MHTTLARHMLFACKRSAWTGSSAYISAHTERQMCLLPAPFNTSVSRRKQPRRLLLHLRKLTTRKSSSYPVRASKFDRRRQEYELLLTQQAAESSGISGSHTEEPSTQARARLEVNTAAAVLADERRRPVENPTTARRALLRTATCTAAWVGGNDTALSSARRKGRLKKGMRMRLRG